LINKVKHLQTVSFCLFDFYFAKVANLGYIMCILPCQTASFLYKKYKTSIAKKHIAFYTVSSFLIQFI